jgi:hypothetical protein
MITHFYWTSRASVCVEQVAVQSTVPLSSHHVPYLQGEASPGGCGFTKGKTFDPSDGPHACGTRPSRINIVVFILAKYTLFVHALLCFISTNYVRTCSICMHLPVFFFLCHSSTFSLLFVCLQRLSFSFLS